MTSEESQGEVARGAYVLTVGFSMSDGKARIPFDLLVQGLNATKMPEAFRVGTKTVGLEEIAPDWAKRLGRDEYSRDIREYFVKDSVGTSGHDELLARIFFRKMTLLTTKGKAGLVTIKLREIPSLNVELFDIPPGKRDEGGQPHKRLVLEHSQPVETQEVIPTSVKTGWRVKARIFLQVQLVEPEGHGTEAGFEDHTDPRGGVLSRVAAISLVLEPEDGSNDLFNFFSNTDRLRVDLTDMRKMGPIWSTLADEVEVGSQHYVVGTGVQLLDFVSAVAWLDVLRTIAAQARIRGPTIEQPGFEQFVGRIHEMRNEISFHYKEVVMTKLPASSLEPLASDALWVKSVTKLLGFTSGLEQDQRAFVRRKAVQLSPYTIFALNRGLYLSDVKNHPENLYSRRILDYSEWGHRWGVSWAILMSSMLCQLSQTFIVYNQEMEKHVSERKEATELRELTHKAFEDFATFYDVDLIQAHLYREEFETAKETFGIDNYYDILIKRLTLFSNYEIAGEASKLNRVWFRVSLVLGASGVIIAIILKFLP